MSPALQPEMVLANACGSARTLDHPLDAIFAPRSVAVFGPVADAKSPARAVLHNLANRPVSNGNLYTIGQRCTELPGISTRARIGDVPERIDLAVIGSPAAEVPEIVGQCVDAGVRGAVILSEGCRDAGPAGAELEQWILAEARQGPMRVIGPKSLGVIRPCRGLNATAASVTAWPGKVAFLSESRALCNAILDLRLRERAGFSALVSVGTMIDVDWGDLIDYLGNDPLTSSIVIYMKTMGRVRSLVSAACRVAPKKPIIVLKAGRAAEAAGDLDGAGYDHDQVLDAVFRQSGVLRVRRLSDLFDMADVLGKQPCPNGPRLAIVTNAGGPALLATDALLTSGGELAHLSTETVARLDAILDTRWSDGNPVDLSNEAHPEHFARALELVVNDPGTDGLLLILAPQTMVDSTLTAEGLRGIAAAAKKPILASWMGGVGVLAGQDVLSKAGISTFAHPDTAARAFRYLWKHSENLQLLEAGARLRAAPSTANRDPATTERIGTSVRHSGRDALDHQECRELLAAYKLPGTRLVSSNADDAAALAAQMGYPVTLHPLTRTITEPRIAVGSQPDLCSSEEVHFAYTRLREQVHRKQGPGEFLGVTLCPAAEDTGLELSIGSRIDPQFGPVLWFGMGWHPNSAASGLALGLPPLAPALARQMVQRTRVARLLQAMGDRASADLAALEHSLVQFGQLVIEQPWICEIELSLLLTSPGRLWSVATRAVAWRAETFEDEWPRPVFAS